MVSAIPLKFEFDSTTPSSLAEFTSSDTVDVVNGGTGVSSTLLWPSVSSAGVSAANFYTPDAGAFNCMGADGVAFFMKRENGGTYENLIKSDEGTITIQSEDDIHFLSNTGEKFMRLNESGGDGEVELYYNNSLRLETTDAGLTITGAVDGPTSVSATDVSAVSLVIEKAGATGMPIPAPYGFVYFTSDGTAADTEQTVGIGCTTSTNISDSSDFTWDDVNKRFNVLKTGTYEITLSIVLTVAATTTLTLQLYSTSPGSSQFSADARVHSSIDPHIYTVSWVGTIAGGAFAYATTVDDGGTDITVNSGSTLTVKRLI